jgi:hypothetical protein
VRFQRRPHLVRLVGSRLFVDPGFQPTQVYQQQLRIAKMALRRRRTRTASIDVGEVRDMLPEAP